MIDTVTAIDIALSIAVLAIIGLTLVQRSRKTQVMAFLGLGVILSLVWLRLGSLDVGLAEAALGSGILSAILVVLAASPGSHEAQQTQTLAQRDRLPLWLSALLGVGSGVMLVVVIANIWLRAQQQLPQWETELTAGMDTLPVDHEITGVLLAFRAYDTLLESAVLMFGALIARTLLPDDSFAAVADGHRQYRRVARALDFSWPFRVLVPLLLLLGIWLLFAGTTQPGGAFQSGALVAGMLIMLHLVGARLAPLIRYGLTTLAILGVTVFVLAAGLGLLVGAPWFTWPTTGDYAIILTIEITLTVGIAMGLLMLYLAVAYRWQPTLRAADAQEVNR